MKIKSLGVVCTLLLFVGMGIITLSFLRTVDNLHTLVLKTEQSLSSLHAAEELKNAILERRINRFLLAMTQDPRYVDRLKLNDHEITQMKVLLRKNLSGNPRGAEVLLEGEAAIESYEAEVKRIKDSGLSPLALFQSLNEPYHTVNSKLDHLSDLVQLQSFQGLERARHEDQLSHILSGVAFGLCIILIGGIYEVVRRTVIKPLRGLRESARRFGNGDWTVRARLQGLQELRDVTAVFNEMADNLDRQREQQIRFLATLAHDLRNPLSAIRMATELVMTDYGRPRDEGYQMLEIVNRQAGNLDSLVTDLLDMARIEGRRLELRREPHDLRELMRDTARIFSTTSPAHTFILDLPEMPLTVQCDIGRISQVLNNLVHNAVKYSPAGGRIEIRGTTVPEWAVITVADQGIGIAADELERIFEPYRRAQAVPHAIAGAGLGLASAKGIIEAHDGRIHVESSLGKGSLFSIHLPLMDGAFEGPSRSPRAASTDASIQA